jgi:hypothetical protein
MSPRTAKVEKKFPLNIINHVLRTKCQQMSPATRNGSFFSVEIFDAWHLTVFNFKINDIQQFRGGRCVEVKPV